MPLTTRALLLTDVVDSTKLSEALGDERMAQAWVAHDRVARDLLVPHRGREIDKTDGFLLLFESASDGANYALAYHRAIAALDPPMQARAGLHVGDVILTENSLADIARGAKPLEVDGLAKPIAARVMSLALPGQTLLTQEAREALGATQLRVESHGYWRMKGVSQPVELFEIGDSSAPFTPPPDGTKVYRVVRDGDLWLPVREIDHGLPRERDAFVGREADLQELAHRLDGGAALVSVLGIGGTGKTRFVTHYGWTWLGSWPGGAWFCDLSEARGVDSICVAVARALDVPLSEDDPAAQLGHAIAGRGKCLIILDNFEQVARHAPETLGKWLDRASEAQFVVTTREVLGLPGEVSLALAPLRESEALTLFVTRAAQAKRDFALTDAERPDVQALVKLLDMLPLAIELAAARVRVMPPRMLLQRMSERFRLLTSSGGRHTRQATLHATLDWSWELLSPDEQHGLAQLSVFEGGFTLEAAEAVLSLPVAWPADVVQSLLDKSLVRRMSDERFDLLVSVQEYAAEKLQALGGRGEAEARHGTHHATHGTQEALDALVTHGGVARWRALALELENLVAACRRAASRLDGPTAEATFAAAWSLLGMKGPFHLAVELGELVLAIDTLGPAERARVLRIMADALANAGRSEVALGHCEEALAIHRELGDRRGKGRVLLTLGVLCWRLGRLEEAMRHYQEALAIQREASDRRVEGLVLGSMGVLHTEQGRMDEALQHYQEALAIHREVGDRTHEGLVLGNLGIVHFQQGRMEEALRHYEDALAIHREVSNRKLEGVMLGNLGVLNEHQGRREEALQQYQSALAIDREVGNRRSEALSLGRLGLVHAQQGRVREALQLGHETLAIAREVSDRRLEGSVLGHLGAMHAHLGRLDEAREALVAGEALLRAVGDSIWLGRLLCQRGECERLAGDLVAARARLAEAESLAQEVKAGADSEFARWCSKLRAALGKAPDAPPH